MKPALFIATLVAALTPNAPITLQERAHVEPVDVEIEAPDGLLLAARLYRSATPGPAVLFLHQGDRVGPKTGYETLAALLADRGVHALVLDFRGYGGSVNEHFTGANWQEANAYFEGDVDAALGHLVRQKDVDAERIGLVGASIGGLHSSRAAGRHPDVRALCLLSANLGSSVASTVEGLADLPVLCIAAEADPHARAAETAREAFALSKNPASLLVVHKGTSHGTALFGHDPRLQDLIAGWMARILRTGQLAGDGSKSR